MGRLTVHALLTRGGHDYAELARPLLRSLEGPRFEFRFVDDPGSLPAGGVVLAASDRRLEPGHAERMAELVERGGGLVAMHGTLAAWSEHSAIAGMARWTPSGPGRRTEIAVRPDPVHPATQRMEPEWKVTDELYLSEGPPAAASVLLRASWRFTEQVVAYDRAHGAGRFVYVGLGGDAATYEDDTFQRLVGRLLLLAAGHEPPAPPGVGLLGYGAIARDHASAIERMPGLRLAAVCDLSSERRSAAERDWGVQTHARAEAMLDDPDVGVVVVGTPPSAHAESVLAALEAGKHVVCEKPFAIRTDDVDRMIDAATARRLVLTVYQSRRWDADYVAVRELVRAGGIGEPFYMESFVGGYSHPCGMWHSHEPVSGGTIYDWGSHYFDWILGLFDGSVTAVTANAHKLVWHDVTNSDQVRVDLTFSGGAQATFLQSDIAAARKPKWYLLGTRGAIVADWVDAPVPADFPARVRVLRPAEQGAHEELVSLPRRDDLGFYRNLADHLAWAEPLAVAPDEARRTVAVMEAATRSIAEGGRRLRVDI